MSREETKQPPEPQKRRSKRSRRRSGKGQRRNRLSVDRVTACFAACGRCSFFWAGYRVLHGQDEQESAVVESQSGWLDLIWNPQMRSLVHKSYGVRLDVNHFHYEGCCSECRRHFIYQAADDEAEEDSFRIEITPRISH